MPEDEEKESAAGMSNEVARPGFFTQGQRDRIISKFASKSFRHPERSEPPRLQNNNPSSRACRGISSVAVLALVKDYFIYILSNNAQVLYIGVTGNLDGRLFAHIRERDPASFAARYNLDRLVYYERFPTALEAIARETQLKAWSREKKKRLIQKSNPMWRNLLDDLKSGTVEIKQEGKILPLRKKGTQN